jgi:RNA polymerase sigma-70 factor (ECF subfamily)
VAGLDEAAFSTFYARTARGLWSYIYRVTGNGADADEICQEAFLRLLRAGPDPSDDERCRRFVYRVAGNLIIDRWRSTARDRRAKEDIQRTSPVSPITDSPEDVIRTFEKLSARDRALLWLAYVEEQSHHEIAASLGVGRGSVKVLLFRARRRLRHLLTHREQAVKA